jgi:hypothetical protein
MSAWSVVKSLVASGVRSAVRSAVASASNLFAGGEEGGLYILSPAYMYTDRAGTTNVTVQDDFVGYITDNSGNANSLIAPSDAARALAKTDGSNWWIRLDKVDDNYSTTFASQIIGTMLIGTRKGTIHIEVDIPAGAWSLTPNPAYFPGNTVTDIIIKNGVMTAAELANAKAWLASRGSPAVYTAGSDDLVNGFRSWGILTSVTIGADMSAVTSLLRAFESNQITAIPPGLFDNTPNVTSFQGAFYANQITAIPPGLFDNTPNVTSFQSAFNSNQITTAPASLFNSQVACTNYINCFANTDLTQTSIDNVLVSIASSYTTNSLTGGTFNQSGGSAPSAIGQAAIDTLRAAGMTVTVTGDY